MLSKIIELLLAPNPRTIRNRPQQATRGRKPILEQLENRSLMAVLDLTGAITAGTLNGGRFELISQQPAGSGVIDSFVRLHDVGPDDTDTPEGHNTSGRNQGSPKLNYDENSSPVFTHDLQLKDIPLVTVDHVRYREFRLDLNEPNNSAAPPVSLNKFKVFTNSSGGILASGIDISELGTLRWDMDGGTASAGATSGPDQDSAAPSANGNWVNLNDRNHGSGQADLRVLVPDSAFNGVKDNAYVYLFSRFGDTQAMTGGYEEWYVDKAAKETAVNIVTQIHQTAPIDQLGPLDDSVFNVAFASTVHDTAFVTDSKGNAVTTGSVTFSFFSTIDCTGSSIDFTDTNGADGWSTGDFGPLFAGDYSFAARYNGDGTFAQDLSDCEPLHVNRGAPGEGYNIETIIHDANHGIVANGSAVDLGSVMHDTSTVTPTLPAFPTPTGSVTYEFYKDTDCDGDGDVLVPPTEDVTIANNGSVPESSDTDPLHAGCYAFRATYNGDNQYDPGTSAWEPFRVNKAQLSISTLVHDEDHNVIPEDGHVPRHTIAHDTATVTGQVELPGFAIGAITFTFEGAPIATSGLADPPATARSVDVGPLAANTAFNPVYTFNASVAETDDYFGATSADENFVVDHDFNRMTGGGSVFTDEDDTPTGTGTLNDVRITHGFELHCDETIDPNRLEINWEAGAGPEENNFHLDYLTAQTYCFLDPAFGPAPPNADFNTFVGYGVGSLNGEDGYTINFVFTDAGEPGSLDTAYYLIWLDSNGNGVVDGMEVPALEVRAKFLSFGNHQAH